MDEQEFARLLKEHNEVLSVADKLDKKLLTEKQKNAFKMIEDDFLNNLDVDEDGNVKMTFRNIEVLNRIDEAFAELNKTEGSKMLKQFTSNISNIVKSNAKYFSALDGQAKVLPILPKVTKAMSGWLGIEGGKVKQNGFIDQLISSDSAKVAVKNVAMKIVLGQQGLADSKKQLKELIEGNPQKLGLFEKHYRTFAVDMNAQIDRATSNVIRADLKLQFAIYAGGLVEKSRIFCEEHNGKIYHISEILKFNPEVAIPPNYEPISDLGGYNCRHHLRWISKAMAKAKGKNVEEFENVIVKPEVKPEPEPKPEVKPKEKPKRDNPEPYIPKSNLPTIPSVEKKKNVSDVKRIETKESFDKIPPLLIPKFKIPEEWKKVKKDFDESLKNQKKYNSILESKKIELEKLNIKYKKLLSSDRENAWKVAEEYNSLLKEINGVVIPKINNENIVQNTIGKTEFLRMLNQKESVPVQEFTVVQNKRGNVGNFKEGLEIFKKLVSRYELKEDFKLNIIGKTKKDGYGRAFYRDNENSINVLPTEKLTTIVHELVHSVENNNRVLKYAVDFLNKRTKDSELKRFRDINKAYRIDEVYKEGGFFSLYVGKIYQSNSKSFKEYNGIRATEVLTMGVERMLKNPVQFHKEDREHFELIFELFFK